MELKEARKEAARYRKWENEPNMPNLGIALITLDNQITELEAEMKQILSEFDEVEKQRDELLGALDILNQDGISVIQVIKTLETIKKVSDSVKIKQSGVAGRVVSSIMDIEV